MVSFFGQFQSPFCESVPGAMRPLFFFGIANSERNPIRFS
jgi:hypothetical protein